MAVVYAPESAMGKELWKWDHTTAETHPLDSTIHGMRPTEFQPYPAMGYKVTNRNPLTFDSATAGSPREQSSLEDQGFVFGGRLKAVDRYDAQQREFAKLAANRAYSDRTMSEAAQAEARDADAATLEHLPVIPETPVKRRGRKPKAAAEQV